MPEKGAEMAAVLAEVAPFLLGVGSVLGGVTAFIRFGLPMLNNRVNARAIALRKAGRR
ncbi:hypothetical protein [Pseudolysinimonas sp.]